MWLYIYPTLPEAQSYHKAIHGVSTEKQFCGKIFLQYKND
jgi:hypothetical protein